MTMSAQGRVADRIRELIGKGDRMLQDHHYDGLDFPEGEMPDSRDFFQFRTEGLNIVQRAFGESSEHYKALRRFADGHQTVYTIPACVGVLRAALADLEGGYLFELRALVQADVLEDMLEQAEHLLKQKYHVAAATLAGAVLENTLRKLCDSGGIEYHERTNINSLNTALAKAGVYNKLVQKQVTAMADIRNNADHGKLKEFSAEDVRDMVKWVRRFAAERLQ